MTAAAIPAVVKRAAWMRSESERLWPASMKALRAEDREEEMGLPPLAENQGALHEEVGECRNALGDDERDGVFHRPFESERF